MREIPILFSDEMVRALLDGRKTQTRRPYRPRAPAPYEILDERDDGSTWPFAMDANDGGQYHEIVSPLGEPGDVLWVRECWAQPENVIYYRATDANFAPPGTRWTPSIHQPRWAARIFLRVTDVRVERVRDITEEDARAEGVGLARIQDMRSPSRGPVVDAFASLWDAIYAPRGLGWSNNPWVWAVTFEPVEADRG